MPDQQPKYYRFHRRTIGNMNAATKVLGRFTTASIGGTVLGGVGTLMAGAKIALLLPIIMGIVAFAANTINDLLFYIISVSEIDAGNKPPETPKEDVQPPQKLTEI